MGGSVLVSFVHSTRLPWPRAPRPALPRVSEVDPVTPKLGHGHCRPGASPVCFRVFFSALSPVFVNRDPPISPCARACVWGLWTCAPRFTGQTGGGGPVSPRLWATARLKRLLKVGFTHWEPSPGHSKDSWFVQPLRAASDRQARAHPGAWAAGRTWALLPGPGCGVRAAGLSLVRGVASAGS